MNFFFKKCLSWLGDYKSLYFILALGFVIRLLWVLFAHPEPMTDFRWYLEAGKSLAAGEGYVLQGEPSAFWPVGYPFFLACVIKLFGSSLMAIKIAQLGLYLIAALCLYRLCRMWGNVRMANAVVLLHALHPNGWVYPALLSVELLYQAVLFGAILCFVLPMRKGVLSGILFGLACLVKPQTLPIPAALALCAIIQSRSFKPIAKTVLVYLLLALTVLPYQIRNYRQFGSFFFVSNNGGINLFIGHHEESTGTFSLNEQSETKQSFNQVESEVERSKVAAEYAKEYIKQNPVGVITRIPKKLYFMWHKDVEGWYWHRHSEGMNTEGWKPVLWVGTALAQGYYLALLLTASIVLIRFRRHVFHRGVLQSLLLIVYFSALAAVFFGSTRFHYPVLPFVMMIACYPLTLYVEADETASA